jgi:transketolase
MAGEAVRDRYGKVLARLGETRPEIVVLDADLSGSTKTAVFGKKFPERFFNMGIAEQNMIGTAAGLAKGGKVPFASTFAIFATGRAWEQIRQAVAYSAVNVKIVASHGGVTVGDDGGSHQSVEDLALMRVLPNMVVIVPADAVEMEKVIECILDYQGPVYVRGARIKFPIIYGDDYEFRIGRGTVLRVGRDLALVGCGLMVHHALEAAEILAKEGLGCRVINMSTLKPLDEDLLLAAARECGAVLTCEEHLVTGGLGSAVAELLSERCPVPLKRVGVTDTFGISGQPEALLKHFRLMPEDIAAAARQLFARKESASRAVSAVS